ncbi:zinc ABC transporter substrate-binding protein AztC [Nonomuraea sp. NPDC050663]|uniref:zinc ABC transporter substrate-binding protein AztC n=1 Tax=Nonomuraea sp. NPDC050663 TaxID=3364370 RepID=UPI00379BF158
MTIRLTLLALLAGLLTACGAGPRAEIVVTTNILGDLTRAVVGDQAGVEVLMGRNADPHSFGVSAQQAASMERARLIVSNGLGLEEGVLRNVEAARERGVPVLAVAEGVGPIRYRDGGLDPHFWTDPARARKAVDLIAAAVIDEVDGVDPARVRANAAAYRAQLDELDAWMTGQFAALERRSLVTDHHVFGYLAERYDFEVIGAVIPSGTTLASPSASDLKELADAVRRAGVPAVFADSSQPDRLARVMAEEAGLDVTIVSLDSESLTDRAPTYVQMMRANTTAIVDGLSEKA